MGLTWRLDKSLENVAYYGCGPEQSTRGQTPARRPVLRRLRFRVTKLGVPATDHDDYRLQIRRIIIDRERAQR